MNTAMVHHDPRPSRLPALSLLVAGAATVLSVAALSVAADDDVGSVVPRSAPAVVTGRDSATIIQSEIDKALAERRADAGSDVAPLYDEAKAFPPYGSVAVVSKTASAEVTGRDSATIIQSEIDKALAEHRADAGSPTIEASDVTPMYDEAKAFPPYGSVAVVTPPSRGVSTVFRS